MKSMLTLSMLLVAWNTFSATAQAQIGWVGYGSGTRAGMVGLSPWRGVAPRGGIYNSNLYGGSGGPRSVTWYTPGLGYSSNVQTGLPWHNDVISRPPRADAPGGLGEGQSIARQQRAARRMETLYALRDYEKGRRQDIYRQELLAAAAKKKEKEAAVAQKGVKPKRPAPPLLVDIQPTRDVPYEKRTTPGQEPTVTSPASATEKVQK